MATENQVYCLRGPDNQPEWYAIVGGEIFGPWDNRGAAVAGQQTEERRLAKRKAPKEFRGQDFAGGLPK